MFWFPIIKFPVIKYFIYYSVLRLVYKIVFPHLKQTVVMNKDYFYNNKSSLINLTYFYLSFLRYADLNTHVCH